MIIKCTMENFDELSKLYDRVVLNLTQNINYPKWTYKVYPNDDSVRWAIERGTQYACTDDGKIVGAFVINNDSEYEYFFADISVDEGEYLSIHSLCVDTTCRHKGYAQQMVNYTVEKAKADGYKAVILDVVPTNTPAKALYENLGFNFLGDFDLHRGYKDIPRFSVYELII